MTYNTPNTTIQPQTRRRFVGPLLSTRSSVVELGCRLEQQLRQLARRRDERFVGGIKVARAPTWRFARHVRETVEPRTRMQPAANVGTSQLRGRGVTAPHWIGERLERRRAKAAYQPPSVHI